MKKLILNYEWYEIIAFSPLFFLIIFYFLSDFGLINSEIFWLVLFFITLVLLPLYLMICSVYYLRFLKTQPRWFSILVLILNVFWFICLYFIFSLIQVVDAG